MTVPPDLQRYLSQLAREADRKRRGLRLYEKLLENDERLVAKGFPPISPWWKAQLHQFYSSGKRRFVGRVGRRGGKSSTISRVAVTEAVWGDFVIPPGDLGIWPITSQNKPEAAKRLLTIKAILEALGIGYEPIGDGIPGWRIKGMPRAFQVFAATIKGVSGFTGIGEQSDEVAKWQDVDTGANPATEVFRSISPTILTQPNAHQFRVSSPFSTLDAHHEMMEEGDTDEQMVATAPTWVANPSITEEETHKLEPDEETWQREYAAIPMGSKETSFFDARAIDAAVRKDLVLPLKPVVGAWITAGGDLAFEKNSAVLAFAHRIGEWDALKTRYRLAELVEKRPIGGPLMPGEVMGEFVERMRWHGVETMMADGHYRMTAVEHLEAAGLLFTNAPEGAGGKAETFVRARIVVHGGRLELPNDQRLIRQLKNVTSKPTAGGHVSVKLRQSADGSHGDLVSGLVLALWQKGGYESKGEKPPMTEGERMEQAAVDQWREENERREQGADWILQRFG